MHFLHPIQLQENQESTLKECQQIHQICRHLQFPYFVASTACILFHSFFAKHPLQDFTESNLILLRLSTAYVLISCVILASKIEETTKKVKEIILVGLSLSDLKDQMDSFVSLDGIIVILGSA